MIFRPQAAPKVDFFGPAADFWHVRARGRFLPRFFHEKGSKSDHFWLPKNGPARFFFDFFRVLVQRSPKVRFFCILGWASANREAIGMRIWTKRWQTEAQREHKGTPKRIPDGPHPGPDRGQNGLARGLDGGSKRAAPAKVSFAKSCAGNVE